MIYCLFVHKLLEKFINHYCDFFSNFIKMALKMASLILHLITPFLKSYANSINIFKFSTPLKKHTFVVVQL